MRLKSSIFLGLIIAVAAILVGCSGTDDPGTPTAAPPAEGAGGVPNSGQKGGVAPPGV